MQTSAANLYAEPVYALVGDPTTALGAGMVDLGLIPEVTLTKRWHRTSAQNSRAIDVGDGQGGQLIGVDVTLQLHNNQIAILNALFQEITDETGATGYETEWGTISPQTLVLIPQSDKAVGPTNPNTTWIPGFVADTDGTITRRMTPGAGVQANSSPYTVAGRGTLVTADANDEAFETWARIMFDGDPDVALGGSPATSWTLPSPYTP